MKKKRKERERKLSKKGEKKIERNLKTFEVN